MINDVEASAENWYALYVSNDGKATIVGGDVTPMDAKVVVK